MSTRARVGIVTPTGVRSILVKSDGSPDPLDMGLGEALIFQWNTADLARELIDGGDCICVVPRRVHRVFGGDQPVEHPADKWPMSYQCYDYLWDGVWLYRVSSLRGNWGSL